jgi:nitroreductase
MEYESFLELVKKRRSYWEFKSDPVPDDLIERIVDAARYAPSGFNCQPWEFIVIKEQELKESVIDLIANLMPPPGKRTKAAHPPHPAKDPMGFKTAPVLIVLCGDTRVRNFAPPHLQQNEKRWLEVLTSSLAIAYQYMHLAATSLGLATRWVSAVASHRVGPELKELLGIPGEFVVYDMLALGYSDFQPHPKKMRALAQVLHLGRCNEKDFRTEAEVEEFFSKR